MSFNKYVRGLCYASSQLCCDCHKLTFQVNVTICNGTIIIDFHQIFPPIFFLRSIEEHHTCFIAGYWRVVRKECIRDSTRDTAHHGQMTACCTCKVLHRTINTGMFGCPYILGLLCTYVHGRCLNVY